MDEISMENGHKTLLSVKNLKTYFFQDEGTVKAVDGATFDVYPGKTLGIVGESGWVEKCDGSIDSANCGGAGRIIDGEIKLRRASGEELDLTRLHPDGKKCGLSGDWRLASSSRNR